MDTTTTHDWKLKKLVTAYTECALWSSTDEDGEPLDTGEPELAPETQATFTRDMLNFWDYCDETLGDSWHDALSLEQIGHDFWLTRNGHGAGFWDRGLGELGRKLSDAAKTFGTCHLYVGDDGLIYAA